MQHARRVNGREWEEKFDTEAAPPSIDLTGNPYSHYDFAQNEKNSHGNFPDPGRRPQSSESFAPAGV
jgi:hypothetical protein